MWADSNVRKPSEGKKSLYASTAAKFTPQLVITKIMSACQVKEQSEMNMNSAEQVTYCGQIWKYENCVPPSW